VADPYAIRAGAYFYLYYLGQDRARPTRQRIGLARSADGVHWEKLRSNPILEMDDGEAGLGEPAVWSFRGFYWMLYTVRDFAENRSLRLARSIDGVHWVKLPAVFTGSAPWNSKVLCDPTVLVEGDEIRVWFGGGDVASPDENLHGQIGLGRLRTVN
jgi:sucrose-6-phosphate hydrolase SacC (GH32 family)